MSKVKRLEESDEAFSLQGYKAELGKPYNRLTLCLCSSSDYLDYALKGLVDVISNGSDSEGDSEKYTHTSSLASNTKTTPSDLSGPLPITTSSVSGSTTVHKCDANVSGVISSNNLSRPHCSASI